jgi:hypothetical protein
VVASARGRQNWVLRRIPGALRYGLKSPEILGTLITRICPLKAEPEYRAMDRSIAVAQ